ncbi:PD-(D/E)XK nuclease family protein [Tenacibaculum retecalamus]|uniref:PD-(D/E)XK nuclease family protein n=1 Tax=Tenacibaculum retecalamus TaxID=3018315 RepID=UPI0023D91746|nr:PD-(D/E)XK nuclease family protein [Tenacibaculum retecalamus]WBX71115.1 PD-(D/E)XK nuclease family protein [Tenacibaculum retecalamus]
MNSFISETLDTILQTTKSFENVVFVLPSQRAGVFVKQTFKNKILAGFLPQILNIGDFVEEISEINKADSVQLLFHFYTIYKEVEENPDTFDVFSSWAFTVLQDFNEIDQHLINPKDIFVYLRDIHRLQKWSVKGEFKETELMKDHFSFMEKLEEFYAVFYQFLVDKKIGYQGVLYREATKKVEAFINKNQNKKYYFIGFNALNTAEEFLFQKFLSAGNSEVYWDIDKTFYEGNHQAGSFLRKYKKQWKYYEKNSIQTIKNYFSESKNIQVIGASKNITQIKHAGEILSKLPNHNNTALVLADETLLPITLNSLPKSVEAINITMGYPLKDIPTTSLVLAIFQLFNNQEKLQKQDVNQFYHKDIIRFLKDAAIYKLLQLDEGKNIADTISETVVKENNTFVSQEYINVFFSPLEAEIKDIVSSIFNQFSTIGEFLSRILRLIDVLKDNANDLEKEYLFRFYTAFTQLQNLHIEFNYVQDLKTLHQFFRQLIQSESLSFQGEPLQGLQLMGVLETRMLDFENVIITSVNEGVLPASSQQNTFIPFDVKIEFGLPTYKEKDALFSYHFFRLLQRAKNIFILYNTEHDVFGSGEKSRFVTQLEMMRGDITEKIISPKVVTSAIKLKEIQKDDKVLKRLEELAKKGISPSALTNYLYNPIAFYKQKILKINEFDNVEETVAANTMGTVVHDTLDKLYQPYFGKFLKLNDVRKMQEQSKELVSFYFSEHFKNGDVSTGKNRLVFEVANRFVENFLNKEIELLKDESNQLKIIETEKKIFTEIIVEGIDFPIRIHGEVDRIDELNGVTRIIDYKTGMVDATKLKVTDFTNIRDLKHHKAIQVMLYAFIYWQTEKATIKNGFEAGIISFKNLKSGFLKMNFSSNYRTPDNEVTEEKLEEFMNEITAFLKELYNPEVGFIEPADLPY